MASQAIDIHRAAAEIFHGPEICKQKSLQLLKEIGLPNGLLPLQDIQEFGYNRTTGFMWMKQKNDIFHSYKKIGKNAVYGKEFTAFVEKNKMKNITGVKSKEYFLTVSLTHMYRDENDAEKVTFSNGLMYQSFPASAFRVDEDEAEKK